ncbi:c-type cytochrome [Stigmatella aurantiaca]|uniref:Cytochrome c n=1 Tax=Stigmatella aurantiaca (strain DW4/3-1) TaxID=378806 RepID=Q08TT1_STIAD|nr:c-type cytochrome [Stigmatella aurantiaca]ADO72657.1 cytochrome c [Stigmatella aurantiaca DW4/3-1]EAU63901.1 class I diheme cytochrome c [Stigmatella aurantiaca DW4/3-1]
MVKKILIGLGGLVVLLVAVVVVLFLVASSKLSATVEAPLPPIAAATDAQSIARGKHIFESVCYDCHVQDGSGRAAGGVMPDLPKVFGAVITANLTSHPTAGIKGVSDGLLARAVRFGVRRDGHRMVIMPLFGMSDEDLSAVLGFLRTNDELFAPDERVQTPPQLSPVGKLALGMGLAPMPTWPASGIKAPPKGPTVEWGAYLAQDVYVCAECHTPGVDGAKARGPDAFKGGFKFVDTPEGGIYSTNITFGQAGLAQYTVPEFSRALQHGINREGIPLRLPMIRVRNLDDVDVQALYTFLQSVPKAEDVVPPDAAPRVKANLQSGPEKLFSDLGCALCHGADAKYRDRLKPAVGKPAVEVARWIRNPEATSPGTQMPTYHDLLTDEQALEMANWVQAYAAKIP